MIRIISTDFDGTVLNHFNPPAVSTHFLERLATLRAGGAVWVVNTGRALFHLDEGLRDFGFPTPDYAITCERELFKTDGHGGWLDFGDWNARCKQVHDELHAVARPVFHAIRDFVQKETTATFIDDLTGIGIVAASEADMDRILDRVRRLSAEFPHFHFQRNTVYVRFCHRDYSKGAALGELSRLLGLGPDSVFAAGDHLNDLPMLDGIHARWVACPSNSAPAVKQLVAKTGGYVARCEAGDGIAEALDFFLAK